MPLNIDWQQILLHLFNFVLLFAILYFMLYKPVKQFMDKRTAYYKQLQDEAQQNLAEAQQQKAAYAARLEAADQEIAQSKAQAHREAEQALAASKRQAEAEAQCILAQARAAAETQRSQILHEAEGQIRAMVASAADKLVTPENTSQAFDQFLAATQRSDADE